MKKFDNQELVIIFVRFMTAFLTYWAAVITLYTKTMK